MTGEAIEAQVLRFLRGHPGSSLRAVRTAIPARNASVDEALRALNLAQRVSCTQVGWFALRSDGTRYGRANGKRPGGRQVAYRKAVAMVVLGLRNEGWSPEEAQEWAEYTIGRALPARQREQHQREERRPA